MANQKNFDRRMTEVIEAEQARGNRPRLLLHACCAPCSSACLERVTPYFDVTLFYYNPNITDRKEYEKRAAEAERLVREMSLASPVSFLLGEYDPDRYFNAVKGYEKEPEGGKRCGICFRLRLDRAAREAAARGFDYVTTTLTLSPLKNASLLNAIGEETVKDLPVSWLPSDFKKRDGYHRSLELSGEYGLYRQNYCGCIYSKEEREAKSTASALKSISA